MLPVRVRAKFFFEGEKKFFIKGVTYGPFAPDENGEYFGTPEGAARDLDLMVESGVNLVRIYYVPPRWFLDLCEKTTNHLPMESLQAPSYGLCLPLD